MTSFRTISGTEIVVGREIGRGGEGAVYQIFGAADRVAKIYTDGKEGERQNKIRAMVGEGLSAKSDLVAFPIDAIIDMQGRFRGFTMHFASGSQAVHELYTPASRRRAFPKADFRFLTRTATNVARAVASVHATGCVIGDINRSGILVSRQALVTLIDADSFQLTAAGSTYRCRVAVPEYTPPELQNIQPDSVDRNPTHDAFGLAVILFQLLFVGRHPYSGRFSGTSDGTLDEAIREGRFAYSIRRRAQTQTSPPPFSPTLSDLPSGLANAFERAFTADPREYASRPQAKEWVRLLDSMEGELVACHANPSHYHAKPTSGCPWCRIDQQSGRHLFEAAPLSRSSLAGGSGPVSSATGRSTASRLTWRHFCLLALAVIIGVAIVRQVTPPAYRQTAQMADGTRPAAQRDQTRLSVPEVADGTIDIGARTVSTGETVSETRGAATAVAPTKPGAAPSANTGIASSGPTPEGVWPSEPAIPPPPAAPAPEAIERIQAALAGLGFDVGPVDGVLGTRTRRAIEQFAISKAIDPSDFDALVTSAEEAVATGAASLSPMRAESSGPGFRANGIRLSPAALSLFSVDEAVDIQMAMLATLNRAGQASATTSTGTIRVTGFWIDRGRPCKTAIVSLDRGQGRARRLVLCLGSDNAWTDLGS